MVHLWYLLWVLPFAACLRLPRAGTAVVLVLSLVLLPIGGALIWSAARNLQSANASIEAAASQRAQLSVRAMESLIARNALALRVAANSATGIAGDEACTEAARSLAIAPAVAHSNRSAASDRRRSFQAERTMMPMTAAPTP